MLLSSLLDLLEMLIVAILRQPRDDITLRPVDLEGVAAFIVDVVLLKFRLVLSKKRDFPSHQ